MSGHLWTFDEFLTAVGGEPFGQAPSAFDGISIDSRTLQPGDGFFAIAGETFDGHDFIAAAHGAGAATAVVDRAHFSREAAKGHLVVVDDVLEAMRGLARISRKRSSAQIIAVTGSVGKTGTKEMLASALAASGGVHASPASFNNHWGVPLSLARMPAATEFGVFEIGMNHAGEIRPLTSMVRPDIAIITNIEPVHLAYFHSVEDIARAKAEIFEGVQPGGAVVLNLDNRHFDLLSDIARDAGVARIIGFGQGDAADVRLNRLKMTPTFTAVSASVFGEDVCYKLGMPGRHMVQNSLAVLAAVSLAGGDLAKSMLELADLRPPHGRGHRYELSVGGGTATLIDESYNANPASMNAAIDLFALADVPRGGRRIAVLGDMLELGDESAQLHAVLADSLSEAAIDVVYAAGPLMRFMWDALPASRRGHHADTAADLEDRLAAVISPGDVVMVKGSNGSRLGPVVQSLRQRFTDAPTQRQQEDA